MYNVEEELEVLTGYEKRITDSNLVYTKYRYLFKLPHNSGINTGKLGRREKKLRTIIERKGIEGLTRSDDLEFENSILNFWLSLRRYVLAVAE